MNERIRDIKDKLWSEEYWNNPNTDKLLSAQLNRFAELIVKECIQAVDNVGGFNEEFHMNAIKEHFGVEE